MYFKFSFFVTHAVCKSCAPKNGGFGGQYCGISAAIHSSISREQVQCGEAGAHESSFQGVARSQIHCALR